MQTELRELLERAARELDRHLGPGPFNRAKEIRAALEAPQRKLEIEHDGHGGGYQTWFTDGDGNLHEVGALFDHPCAAADWCERNGFAWEVVGAIGDPLVELEAWRAAQ